MQRPSVFEWNLPLCGVRFVAGGWEVNRRGFTLVELFVAVAILVTLAGILVPAIMAAASAKDRHDQQETKPGEPEQSWSMVTRTHDKHWWVMWQTHFVHHPDCPCGRRQAEAVE